MALMKDIKKFFYLDLLLNSRRKLLPPKKVTNSVLLIRFDAIGDYILFRNFIKALAKSDKYEGYKITLLGNSVWKDISEELDSEYIDEFIWIDKKKFQSNVKYKYEQLKRLCEYQYEVVIYPTYSREYAVDKIVKVIRAKEKIANEGNTINYRSSRIKKLGNSCYTRLIETSSKPKFEFYRNKDFFENLLEEELQIKKPVIPVLEKGKTSNNSYVLMIPGAGRPHKMWAPQNFAEIANHLKTIYGYYIILSGSPAEKEIGEKVIKNSSIQIESRMENSGLLDLLELVQNSVMVVTNETSAVHIAAAMGKPAVCISDGSYFGRFHPYPEEMTDIIRYIYPRQISDNFNNFKLLFEKYSGMSNLNINLIEVDRVISEIDKLLKA